MNIQPLSIAPYYGGKSKMSGLLCDMLDYSNTDIFVTPFGGMCRVLLNKPRHKIEIYNDSSRGLCMLLGVLGDPDKYSKLMEFLYETEYSEECFDWALRFRNRHEDNWLQEHIRRMGIFLRGLDKKHDVRNMLNKTDGTGKQKSLYDRFQKQLREVYERDYFTESKRKTSTRLASDAVFMYSNS